MRHAQDDGNALRCTLAPSTKETLTTCSQYLSQLSKALEDHLETKRIAFPRFYFLSTEDLLDILSQNRNPKYVVSFVKKNKQKKQKTSHFSFSFLSFFSFFLSVAMDSAIN